MSVSGSSLFVETIKIKNGAFVEIEPHLQRVQNTIYNFYGKDFKIENTLLDKELFVEKQRCLLEKCHSGVYKCRVLYDSNVRNIESKEYSVRSISSLKVVKSDTINYDFKYADRQNIDLLFGLKNGCDDIIIAKRGMITDSSFSNLVFYDGSRYITPDTYLLNGIKRQVLLCKGVISECAIRAEEIGRFSKIYLINSMLDIEDNVCLNCKNIEP